MGSIPIRFRYRIELAAPSWRRDGCLGCSLVIPLWLGFDRVHYHLSSPLSVLFVVPACNEERHLRRCLESIHAQRESDDDEIALVVVDAGSTDATSSIAADCGATVICVERGNPGAIRNVGAASRDADFLAFVDADCVLPPNWLQNGLAHFDDAGVVAIGSLQALADDDAPWVERLWVRTIVPAVSERWQPTSWLPAFNMLVRKPAFDSLGGFDESLETCEDSDLSFRLGSIGQLRRDHSCPVQHLGESKSLPEFFRRERWRSRGNFQSAFKRGSVGEEKVSLFLPMLYLLTLIALLVAAILAAINPGMFFALFLVILLIVVAVPAGIAYLKRRTLADMGKATLLFAAYLIARGIGSLVPSKRVSRD